MLFISVTGTTAQKMSLIVQTKQVLVKKNVKLKILIPIVRVFATMSSSTVICYQSWARDNTAATTGQKMAKNVHYDIMTICAVAIPFRHRGLDICRNFSCL